MAGRLVGAADKAARAGKLRVKAVVFDFDGTLVDSNRLKHWGFHKIFPEREPYRSVVSGVLREMPEKSRFVALAEMKRRLEELLPAPASVPSVADLATAYDAVVTEGAIRCRKQKGAAELLRGLQAGWAVYLCSMTPETSLRKIIAARQWTPFFKKIYGYPQEKPKVLRGILKQEKITPAEMVMVGDGHSDRSAAAAVGCHFFEAGGREALPKLARRLGVGWSSPRRSKTATPPGE